MYFDEQTGEMVEEDGSSPYEIFGTADTAGGDGGSPMDSIWDRIGQTIRDVPAPSEPLAPPDRFHITDPDWLQSLQDAPAPLVNEGGFIGDTGRPYVNPDPYGTADLPSVWEPPAPQPPGPGPGPADPRIAPATNMTDAQILAAARAAELNAADIALRRRQAAYEDAKIAALQTKAANGTATPTDLSNLARLRAQNEGTRNDLQSAQEFAQQLAFKQQELAQNAAQFAQTLGLSQRRLQSDEQRARASQIVELTSALTNMAGRISPTLLREAMSAIQSSAQSGAQEAAPTAMMPPGPVPTVTLEPFAAPVAPPMPQVPASAPTEPSISFEQTLAAAGSPPPVQGRPLLNKWELWGRVSRSPTGNPDPLDIADWQAGRYIDSEPRVGTVQRTPQAATFSAPASALAPKPAPAPVPTPAPKPAPSAPKPIPSAPAWKPLTNADYVRNPLTGMLERRH